MYVNTQCRPVYTIGDENVAIDFAHGNDMGETLSGVYHCRRPQYLPNYRERDTCIDVQWTW